MNVYDTLSVDYDRFVNWERRLAVELPFIEQALEEIGACRVVDVACGTGQHAIALAQRGYQLVGVDVSAAMIAQAQQNAQAAGVQVSFTVAGFGELATRQFSPFDALLCLGSSLLHPYRLTGRTILHSARYGRRFASRWAVDRPKPQF